MSLPVSTSLATRSHGMPKLPLDQSIMFLPSRFDTDQALSTAEKPYSVFFAVPRINIRPDENANESTETDYQKTAISYIMSKLRTHPGFDSNCMIKIDCERFGPLEDHLKTATVSPLSKLERWSAHILTKAESRPFDLVTTDRVLRSIHKPNEGTITPPDPDLLSELWAARGGTAVPSSNAARAYIDGPVFWQPIGSERTGCLLVEEADRLRVSRLTHLNPDEDYRVETAKGSSAGDRPRRPTYLRSWSSGSRDNAVLQKEGGSRRQGDRHRRQTLAQLRRVSYQQEETLDQAKARTRTQEIQVRTFIIDAKTGLMQHVGNHSIVRWHSSFEVDLTCKGYSDPRMVPRFDSGHFDGDINCTQTQPTWFSELPKAISLSMESGNLHGDETAAKQIMSGIRGISGTVERLRTGSRG